VPGGSRRNLDWVRPVLDSDLGEDELVLLADAQTSGGLLVALPEDEAGRYVAACRGRGTPAAEIVGRVVARGERALRVVR
jgi:selenide,water dikinase